MVRIANEKNYKLFAYACLAIGTLILVIYLTLLVKNGYLFSGGSFSLQVASQAAPFIGSCVGIFFTLAGTFLVIENLRITTINNERNQVLAQKNQFESIFFNLLTQQRQIKDAVKNEIPFTEEEIPNEEVGADFYDNLGIRITIDYINLSVEEKSKENLIKIYNRWFTIYNSDLGHYYRHLFNIIKFVDENPYFKSIENNPGFFRKSDYIKILRSQLSNGEQVLLALNGLTKIGAKFKPYVDDYKLIKNMNLELDMPKEYYSCVPDPAVLINAYPQLKE